MAKSGSQGMSEHESARQRLTSMFDVCHALWWRDCGKCLSAVLVITVLSPGPRCYHCEYSMRHFVVN